MKLKGLISKIIIVAVIITATSLIAVVTNYNMQGVIGNPFRNGNEVQFFANPNPFDDYTIITVGLEAPAFGSVVVENSSGYTVIELYKGPLGVGATDFVWNGKDTKGVTVNPGIYYCHLSTGNRYTSRTIILILK